MLSKIVFILSFMFLLSCVSTENLVITKKYVGKYISTYKVPDEKISIVTTTYGIFTVKDTTFIVPDSVWCYIRREPCAYDYHPDVAWHIERQYFTWQGSNKEYPLKENIQFQILR